MEAEVQIIWPDQSSSGRLRHTAFFYLLKILLPGRRPKFRSSGRISPAQAVFTTLLFFNIENSVTTGRRPKFRYLAGSVQLRQLRHTVFFLFIENSVTRTEAEAQITWRDRSSSGSPTHTAFFLNLNSVIRAHISGRRNSELLQVKPLLLYSKCGR
jgi:hypothetical protein